ncbi:hypothetical protein [uncultured Nocardioides sp.]|uniref:hypothetical protein n=1 Tax=uncultured Nocardioides sp. TaxID=198441 RepID=UPI00260D5791|nr:hypothetical protein [uncultured Nocardioides sp.]
MAADLGHERRDGPPGGGKRRRHDQVLAAARDVLRERFGVEHVTLQVETDPASCHEMSW